MRMIEFEESRISAHHNYLVNGRVTPAFSVGEPDSTDRFFLLGDIVLPGESTPRISGRLFDEQGKLLVEVMWNRIHGNPGDCSHVPLPGGFRIMTGNSPNLLEVSTQAFTNGYLTRITACLFDERGSLRVEPFADSIRVNGAASLMRERPFEWSMNEKAV